jgi:hypothetical protein
MAKTTTGNRNTAVGNNSLICNTSGTGNTAVGGTDAGTLPVMWKNTTGVCNAAFGTGALSCNTTGGCNSSVGFRAGCNVTTGSNNVFVGNLAGTDAVRDTQTGSNNIVLGNNSSTHAHMKIAFTVTSDLRDKMNIEDVPHGLDFVNQLNPISFQFKKSRENDTPHGPQKYGFKAQEILELEGDNPVIINDEDKENLKITTEHLVPVLVNAIKELKAEIELLKNK